MNSTKKKAKPSLPKAPGSIEKGSSLKDLLGKKAVETLAANISLSHTKFSQKEFIRDSIKDIEPLSILQRGHHLSRALKRHLPDKYEDAIAVLLNSLTPPLEKTEGHGLAVFFYLPHIFFVSNFGLDAEHNGGDDPFEVSMRAQYEITKRFSAEFSIRPFLIRWPERTLKRLKEWTKDENPHVRRLCSEGTRPKLPWAMHIPAFIEDPKPVLPILEKLKDDPDLYVRRSVANHIGDIAKDHLDLSLTICERWLRDASTERRWVIRHALRYPAKKGIKKALELRKLAK
jgi:3-methyladenine DNA glycosylase AlkC